MSNYEMPVTAVELKAFKDDIYIGQQVEVMRSDDVFEKKKKKLRLKIIKKCKHFVVCQYARSGALETFKYIQVLLGDGAWLV